jgi:hypothetical protein
MYTLTITLTVPLNPKPHDFARALTEAAREADPEDAKIIRKLGEVVQIGIAYSRL